MEIGKITRLLQKSDGEFEIVYGFEPSPQMVYPFNFGTLSFISVNPEAKLYFTNLQIKEGFDLYKDITVTPCALSPKANEDFLLVIIPDAWNIKSSKVRIAGRYFSEAVFRLTEGDWIELSTSPVTDPIFYYVFKNRHNLFLVKEPDTLSL